MTTDGRVHLEVGLRLHPHRRRSLRSRWATWRPALLLSGLLLGLLVGFHVLGRVGA